MIPGRDEKVRVRLDQTISSATAERGKPLNYQ